MYFNHLFKFKKEFKILKGRSVVFANLPRDRDCKNCVVELSRKTCVFEFPCVLVIYSCNYQDITVATRWSIFDLFRIKRTLES